MRINKEQSMGLMIDMQEKLMPAMRCREGVTNRTLLLLQALKELGVPVIATQQYTKGLGETEQSLKDAWETELTTYEKTTFSCFANESIRTAIARSERPVILVWGVESHICVQQTVLDLLENRYDVYLIADCVDSRTKIDREIALERMRQAGAVITTAESVIYELMGEAGTDEFRRISRLVKQAGLYE